MIETGLNKTEIAKSSSATRAIFITELALGLVLANYNWWRLLFAAVTIAD